MSLDLYLESCPTFDWRAFNCCHFAAGWVKLRTGQDHMAGVPETPTMRDAIRIKARLGGSLLAATIARLGEPIAPADAKVGDLLRVAVEEVELLGIYTGAGIICLDQGGFVFLPLAAATHAWSL